MKLELCDNKQHAYLGELEDADKKSKPEEYTCLRSFGKPHVYGYLADPDVETYSGYDMKLKSTQVDKKGKAKTLLEFKIRCDPEDDGKSVIEWEEEEYTEEKIVYSYKGKYGCPILDASGVEKLREYSGPIAIAVGTLMTFLGSKFLIASICMLMFMGVVFLFFVLAINFHVITLEGGDNALGYIIGVGVTGIIAGGVAAYFFAKVAKKYAVPVLAAWSGATITMMCVSPMKINNLTKLVIICSVMAISVWVGHKYNRIIKALGTAIIGSGMLMFGIGSYAGGFPSMFRFTAREVKGLNDVNASYLGYFFGWIATAALGTFIQLRFFDKHPAIDGKDVFKSANDE